MPKKKKGTGGRRFKAERVKTARKRKHSSTLWLSRQLNDPLVRMAREEGYRSRAAYKLIEIDEKYRLLKHGMTVIDLGVAPGSWSQVAIKKIGGKGKVIGVDLLEVQPITGLDFIQGDFLDKKIQEKIIELSGGKSELIVSDMAANTTGHKQTDHIRTAILCEAAFEFAIKMLNPGGNFVTKTFRGGTEHELLNKIKQHFSKVKHFKPDASRKDSVEIYLVATGFKG